MLHHYINILTEALAAFFASITTLKYARRVTILQTAVSDFTIEVNHLYNFCSLIKPRILGKFYLISYIFQ